MFGTVKVDLGDANDLLVIGETDEVARRAEFFGRTALVGGGGTDDSQLLNLTFYLANPTIDFDDF